jgi:hypothetical protein
MLILIEPVAAGNSTAAPYGLDRAVPERLALKFGGFSYVTASCRRGPDCAITR